MIAEMIHSASLIHDDVVDQADFRRGKPSVNVLWNHKKVGTMLLFVPASFRLTALFSFPFTFAIS
jgi:geranylgeranyl pyrophosphate synthase